MNIKIIAASWILAMLACAISSTKVRDAIYTRPDSDVKNRTALAQGYDDPTPTELPYNASDDPESCPRDPESGTE